MLSNKGFTLIEVLVATIILFVSILTVNIAFKQYTAYKLKQEKYENIYISALSLMNKIENEKISGFFYKNGKINGIEYTIRAKRAASNRNYIYDEMMGGNNGFFLLTLYKITIEMAGKKFVLYKTEY